MAHEPLAVVVRYLRRLSEAPAAGALTDAQLLERFVNQREQAAFEVLVWRHGTMVWSVCRRVLRDAHVAEDAFQATFLLLVRKAGSIGKRQAVGSWLYKVAYRIALRAQAQASARAVHEVALAKLPDVSAADDLPEEVARQEIRAMLDEEVQRLPDKYRTPVILCYLEGKTYEEAAQQLGWPKGTVSTRLTRARELLRTRLARRGIVLSATSLTTALAAHASAAAVPATLVNVTVRIGWQVAVGKTTVASVVSAPVATLVDGVVRAMWVTKLKLMAAVVLAAGVLGTGIGLRTHQVLADKRTPPSQESGPRLSAQANKAQRDGEKLQGSWRVVAFERDGKPDLAQLNKQSRWVFRADRVSIQQNALERAAGTYELVDQAKNPKWIDLELTETMLGQERTFIYLGIYQLEGDALKLCFAPHLLPGIGLLRPTEFDTREAPKWGWSLLVLKREPDTVERQQRQLRWTLRFDTRDGGNYLRQLQALGAILAIPEEDSQFRVIRDLSQRPAQGKIEEIAHLNRIYWIDQKPQSVASLSLALGLASPPRFLVAFFPEKVEQDLLRLELAHAGRKEEAIAETHFEVVKKGDGYELKVVAQTAR